jgi:hypothetical protein
MHILNSFLVFSLTIPNRCFITISSVPYTSTEKAEIVGKTASSFRGHEFAAFSKLVTQVQHFLFGVLGGQAGVDIFL